MGYEPEDMDEFDGLEVIEPLSERTGPQPNRHVTRTTPRLGMSVPGAIGGVLLMGAIAFGANLGLAGSEGDTDATPTFIAYDAPDDDTEPTKGPDAADDETETPYGDSEPTKGPDAEPTDAIPAEEEPDKTETPEATDKPEATPKPTPKPTEKPDATPKPTERPVMGLTLAIKEGAVFIDWSACEVDGGDYYKVVRSKDSKVTWPAGDDDAVVAVTEVGGATKAWDESAPASKTLWYRVFCVRATEDGYTVLSATGTKSIETPAGEPEPTKTPAPEPTALWIESGVVEGAVVISWEACNAEGFSHYRILRKVDGEAALLAEVEDAGSTTFVDDSVEVGVTYHYLVQAKGNVEGDWILLGTTEWAAVTVE